MVVADYRPLTAPYVVTVIGDRDTLERKFRAAGTDVLERLRQRGALIRVVAKDDLHVPAATTPEARVARPLTESGGSTSGQSSSTTTTIPSSGSTGARP